MNNSQHNEEQPIRWMLHFFTLGILGWAFIEGYQIKLSGNEELYAEYLFHLVLLQGVYGAFLILGSATYPIMRGLLEQKLDIPKTTAPLV